MLKNIDHTNLKKIFKTWFTYFDICAHVFLHFLVFGNILNAIMWVHSKVENIRWTAKVTFKFLTMLYRNIVFTRPKLSTPAKSNAMYLYIGKIVFKKLTNNLSFFWNCIFAFMVLYKRNFKKMKASWLYYFIITGYGGVWRGFKILYCTVVFFFLNAAVILLASLNFCVLAFGVYVLFGAALFIELFAFDVYNYLFQSIADFNFFEYFYDWEIPYTGEPLEEYDFSSYTGSAIRDEIRASASYLYALFEHYNYFLNYIDFFYKIEKIVGEQDLQRFFQQSLAFDLVNHYFVVGENFFSFFYYDQKINASFSFFFEAMIFDNFFAELCICFMRDYMVNDIIWTAWVNSLVLGGWCLQFDFFFLEIFFLSFGPFVGFAGGLEWFELNTIGVCWNFLCYLGFLVAARIMLFLKEILFFWYVFDLYLFTKMLYTLIPVINVICWFFFRLAVEWPIIIAAFLKGTVALETSYIFNLFFYLYSALCQFCSSLLDLLCLGVFYVFNFFVCPFSWLVARVLNTNFCEVGPAFTLLFFSLDFFLVFECIFTVLDITNFFYFSYVWYAFLFEAFFLLSNFLSLWGVELLLGYLFIIFINYSRGSAARRHVPRPKSNVVSALVKMNGNSHLFVDRYISLLALQPDLLINPLLLSKCQSSLIYSNGVQKKKNCRLNKRTLSIVVVPQSSFDLLHRFIFFVLYKLRVWATRSDKSRINLIFFIAAAQFFYKLFKNLFMAGIRNSLLLMRAFTRYSLSAWSASVAWALGTFNREIYDSRRITRNLDSALEVRNVAEIFLKQRERFDIGILATPFYLLTACFESNHLFNEEFALVLQINGAMDRGLDFKPSSIRFSGDRHNLFARGASWNTEFDFFPDSLRFFDSDLSPERLVATYLTVKEGKSRKYNAKRRRLHEAILVKRGQYVHGELYVFAPKPFKKQKKYLKFLDKPFTNFAFVKTKMRKNRIWGKFWIHGYLDSFRFKYWRRRMNPLLVPAEVVYWEWIKGLWDYNEALLPTYSAAAAVMMYFVTDVFRGLWFTPFPGGIKKKNFFSLPVSSYYEMVFYRLETQGFGFLKPRHPKLIRGRANNRKLYRNVDFFANPWYVWRWKRVKQMNRRFLLRYQLKKRKRLRYFPNIYTIFEYLHELPVTKLPIHDDWLLSLDSERVRSLELVPRNRLDNYRTDFLTEWELVIRRWLRGDKEIFSRGLDNFFFLKAGSIGGRANFGDKVRVNSLFFEKPLFRLNYLMKQYAFSVAARRNNLYTLGIFHPTGFDKTGRWSYAGSWAAFPEFALSGIFLGESRFRHSTNKQALLTSVFEQRKWHFTKLFKSWRRRYRHITPRRVKRPFPYRDLTDVRGRVEVWDRKNRRLTFFFDTLRKNLMLNLELNFAAAKFRVNALRNSFPDWFLLPLAGDIMLSYSLDLFENSFFRLFFLFGDRASWLLISVYNRLIEPILMPSQPPIRAQFVPARYSHTLICFPQFSNLATDCRGKALIGARSYTFFFISVQPDSPVFYTWDTPQPDFGQMLWEALADLRRN